jgi:hypothetical protein
MVSMVLRRWLVLACLAGFLAGTLPFANSGALAKDGGNSGSGGGEGGGGGNSGHGGGGEGGEGGGNSGPGGGGDGGGDDHGGRGRGGDDDGSYGGGRRDAGYNQRLKAGSSRARDAVSGGYAAPLSAVLPLVRAAVPGKLLDVDLQQSRSGSWLYELVILTGENRYCEVTVDARTRRIVRIRNR